MPQQSRVNQIARHRILACERRIVPSHGLVRRDDPFRPLNFGEELQPDRGIVALYDGPIDRSPDVIEFAREQRSPLRIFELGDQRRERLHEVRVKARVLRSRGLDFAPFGESFAAVFANSKRADRSGALRRPALRRPAICRRATRAVRATPTRRLRRRRRMRPLRASTRRRRSRVCGASRARAPRADRSSSRSSRAGFADAAARSCRPRSADETARRAAA